jgi:hypothetical protein
MRFQIEVTAPADKGSEIDAAGGPGPFVAEIVDRFAPEAMYGSTDRRTISFVAELAADIDVAVLMEICSDRLYAYPTLRPVIPIAELPDFAAAVHAQVGHMRAPA